MSLKAFFCRFICVFVYLSICLSVCKKMYLIGDPGIIYLLHILNDPTTLLFLINVYYILSWMCYSITIQYSPLTLTFVPHHSAPNPPQQLKAIQQRPHKKATLKRNHDNKRDHRKNPHIVLEINETVYNFQRSNP